MAGCARSAAGAPKGQPLLKDDPIARNQPKPDDDIRLRPTVVAGGHHEIGTKEFPVYPALTPVDDQAHDPAARITSGSGTFLKR